MPSGSRVNVPAGLDSASGTAEATEMMSGSVGDDPARCNQVVRVARPDNGRACHPAGNQTDSFSIRSQSFTSGPAACISSLTTPFAPASSSS